MTGNAGQSRKIRFGAYELDEAARELRKNGVSVHLQDQPWEVLRALVERHGEVVSREELRRRLWPDGTFVDFEQSLNKAVNKLREALCDSADKPRYVETVARRGYRFVGALGLVAAGVLVTGLWPPAPKARVTQMTNGGGLRSDRPAVHGGRILYLSGEWEAWGFGSEIWSVSTNGGDQRREKLPFLSAGDAVWFVQVNAGKGTVLIASRVFQNKPGMSRSWTWRQEPFKKCRAPRGCLLRAGPPTEGSW